MYGSTPRGASSRNFFYLTGSEDTSKVLVIHGLKAEFSGPDARVSVSGSFPVIDKASVGEYIQKVKRGVGSVWATAEDMPRVRSLAWAADTGNGFMSADPLFYRLREIKDGVEIEYLRKSIAITAESYNFMLGYLRPGYTEQDIIDTYNEKNKTNHDRSDSGVY